MGLVATCMDFDPNEDVKVKKESTIRRRSSTNHVKGTMSSKQHDIRNLNYPNTSESRIVKREPIRQSPANHIKEDMMNISHHSFI